MPPIYPSALPKSIRLFIGLVTLAPIAYWIAMACYFFGFLPALVSVYIRLPSVVDLGLEIVSVLVWIYFIYVVFKLETIGVSSKLLWVIRFAIMAPISLPMFWYFFIWRSEEYGEWEEE